MRSRVVITVFALLALTGCATSTSTVMPPDPPDVSVPAAPAPTPAPEPEIAAPPPPAPSLPERLRIAAVGDIMLGTDYPNNRLPADDGDSMLAGAAAVLRAADIAFGNLEGVLMDGGEPFKVCQNPSLCYLFRTPSRYVQHLATAGFDVMSLANNHARDFGEDGRDVTMQALAGAGIAHSGREGDVASFEVNNVRVAMIAFAPNPGSHSLHDIDTAALLVGDLARNHDLLLVSFHGGAEGADAIHVPFAEEFYYGESRGDLVTFSHRMVDAGADIVIGHGPHVPRALEIYRERLIAYSLGNFATFSGISVAGIKGLAPLLMADVAPDGRFLQGRIVSMHQQRPHGPRPDPDMRAFRLMRQLSETDFGPHAPLFTDDGQIFPNQARAQDPSH